MAQDASKMAEETTKASQDEAREAKIIEKNACFSMFFNIRPVVAAVPPENPC